MKKVRAHCFSTLIALAVLWLAVPTRGFSTTRLDVATRSVAGSDPNRPQKVNQDASFVIPNMSDIMVTTNNGELTTCYSCFCVMDGHGLKGHLVTQFLATELPQCLAQQLANNHKDDDSLGDWLDKMRQLAHFDLDNDNHHGDNNPHHQEIQRALRNAFHQAHIHALNHPEVPAGRSGTTCIVCR